MLIERVRPLFHLDRRPLHERIEAVVAELAHAVGGACALARLSGEPPDLDVVAAAHADPQAGDELQAILARAPGRRAHRLLGGVLRGEALLRRSVVAVPVVVGGAPCGALVLARAAEREGFGETDLHEAQEVADRLGLVWAGGHAEDEPAERQAVVAALGRRALAGAPPLAVTREALTTVVERLGLQRGAGVRVTDDGGMERVIAVPPPGDADEARADERLAREALAGAGATVVGTALVVPVFGERERVLGAAVLHAGRPDAFDDAARHFAQSLANVVGTATERRRASVRAAHLRSHDALTGLTNRAGLADRGRRALRRSAREGRAAAVLLLEVDGLRALRQRRGRAAADEVLRALAARMEGGLDGAMVARVGGDEFAILAPGAHAEGAALALAERVGTLVAEPVTAAGEEVAVTVSTGIVVAEPGDVDVERLLAAAEEGRARATRLGGGRYELVTRAMRGRAVQRLELEHDLRRALRTGDELDVHFHPVVRLADGALAAFEALLRWHHPRRGLLAAADFLAVAESAGLSAELGDHVLEHAYHSLARWSAALPPGEVPSVQVNVSPQQIARPGFADRLVAALERIGAAPGLMELELTETALIEDHPGALDTLQRLSALGVQLALDDFGTGTAALARLRRVPFDTLKIDRSFIADLAGGGRDAALVEAMIRMGRTLALTVVAEGIETPEQLRLARELGCDRAQGFLFERPLSADAALALARDHRRWDVAGLPSRAPERGGAEADERLLTLSQAAGVLGVSTTTLRRWANAGEVASVRTVGGHRRFRAGDVRGVRARRRTPTLRAGAPPDRALPPLARVVERTGMRVMRAAWADLYDDAPGFFADPRAQEAHARWLQAVAGAAATGRYASLGEATESLMAQARRHGAPLLERHRALERAGDALAGQVAHAGAQRREVAETRRLFVFLRERHLAAAE